MPLADMSIALFTSISGFMIQVTTACTEIVGKARVTDQSNGKKVNGFEKNSIPEPGAHGLSDSL